MFWLLGKMEDVTMEDEPTKFRCNRNNDFINMLRVDISRLFVLNGMDAEQKKILVNTTNEVDEEDAWLRHLPIRLKSPFPNNKASLLDYAARFVSLVQHDCLDKDTQPLNLRINTIKDVITNRLSSDSILSWVIAKINANCKNTLAFSFLEEFQGSSWNEALGHRFQETFLNHQPSTLIILLNVGRYSEKSGNPMKHTTLIGEYYDRVQKRYTVCHYSLLV